MSLCLMDLIRNFPEFGFLSQRDQQVWEDLKVLFPNEEIRFVQETPINNLFAVIEGAKLVYFAVKPERFKRSHARLSDYEYRLEGELFAHNHNLSQQLKTLAGFINPDELPINEAIFEQHGLGENTLYLFVNPSNPSARSIYNQLQELENVKIYTFIVSDSIEDAGSRVMAYTIPSTAYRSLMQRQLKLNQLPTCKTTKTIEKSVQYKREFFLGQEPVIFLENGMRINAPFSLEEIKIHLARIAELKVQAKAFERQHTRN